MLGISLYEPQSTQHIKIPFASIFEVDKEFFSTSILYGNMYCQCLQGDSAGSD